MVQVPVQAPVQIQIPVPVPVGGFRRALQGSQAGEERKACLGQRLLGTQGTPGTQGTQGTQGTPDTQETTLGETTLGKTSHHPGPRVGKGTQMANVYRKMDHAQKQ